MKLAGVTVFNQLKPYPGDDGYVDRYYNCGPASVATCMAYSTYHRYTPDQIRDAIYGENARGYTYTADLANFMATHGLPCGWSYYSDQQARSVILEQINRGRLSIGLFYFDQMNLSGGHFCTIYGADEDYVWIINPFGPASWLGWTGYREQWSWQKFNRLFKGWLITCNRPHRWNIRQYMTRVKITAKAGLDYVNVRPRPDTKHEPVARVPRGKVVLATRWTPDGQVYNRSRVWRYVPLLRGWVADGASEVIRD